MAPSIGLNLRVTGYKHQGGRKYMEDEFGVAYQQTADEKDLEYAFFGIFDGHGGREAALFAKEHLMDFIVRQKGFWQEDDESVLKAIHEGFIQTHYAMWKELEKWPKTASGLPSTAGTTASIAFIRRGKIYIGHVGDSAIVLGVQDPDNPDIWRAEPLTRDHKPESLEESERIQQCGGKVICKSGVPRVVWNRPKMGHKGPVRRSTHIDEIPFLAVARSLGDLWSYNSEENVFVVSPEPDIRVYPVDISKHRCLILGTDGAWNMLTPQNAISTVCQAEKANEAHMLSPVEGKTAWINPSKQLVDTAIERWNASKLRADNTSVVTVMLDPPGPPRAQVLKNRKLELAALNAGRHLPNPNQLPGDRGSMALVTNTTPEEDEEEDKSGRASAASSGVSSHPDPMLLQPVMSGSRTGCAITSRFPNSLHPVHSSGFDLVKHKQRAAAAAVGSSGRAGYDYPRDCHNDHQLDTNFSRTTGRLSDSTLVNRGGPAAQVAVRSVSAGASLPDSTVQCNEISSSADSSPPPVAASSSSPAVPIRGPLSELAATCSSLLPSSSQLQPLATSGDRRKKSLSRELSGLRLDCRTATTLASLTPKTMTRRGIASASVLLSSSSRQSASGRARKIHRQEAVSSDNENSSSTVIGKSARGSSVRNTKNLVRVQDSKVEQSDEPSRTVVNSAKPPVRIEPKPVTTDAASAVIRATPSRPQQSLGTRSASKTNAGRRSAVGVPSSPEHNLRSTAATPLRSLRSRMPTAATTSSAKGGTKRRRPLSEGGSAQAAKSPRTASAAAVMVVSQKGPVVGHRSRQARVLRLKK